MNPVDSVGVSRINIFLCEVERAGHRRIRSICNLFLRTRPLTGDQARALLDEIRWRSTEIARLTNEIVRANARLHWHRRNHGIISLDIFLPGAASPVGLSARNLLHQDGTFQAKDPQENEEGGQ